MLHDEVFQEIDCTACANCCKTLGPDFKEADITRIAKYFKMKLPAFEAEFLQVDEDGVIGKVIDGFVPLDLEEIK